MSGTKMGLADIIAVWPALADNHKASLKEGWDVAEEFWRLHLEALTRISRAIGRQPSVSERSLLSLGCHAVNLYTALLGLTVKGMFDVAAHLVRGMFDCPALLQVVRDGRLAAKFEEGKLKPSDARIIVLKALREGGQKALADEVEAILLQEKDLVDNLAHVKNLHLTYTQDWNTGSVIPSALGRFDPDLCGLLWRGTLREELRVLTALGGSKLGEDWDDRLEKARLRFRKWSDVIENAATQP